MPRLTKDVKAAAQQLGIRTTAKQRGLFDDQPKSKAKPKVYVEAMFITQYRKERNIWLIEKYEYLKELINEQGEII